MVKFLLYLIQIFLILMHSAQYLEVEGRILRGVVSLQDNGSGEKANLALEDSSFWDRALQMSATNRKKIRKTRQVMN